MNNFVNFFNKKNSNLRVFELKFQSFYKHELVDGIFILLFPTLNKLLVYKVRNIFFYHHLTNSSSSSANKHNRLDLLIDEIYFKFFLNFHRTVFVDTHIYKYFLNSSLFPLELFLLKQILSEI